MPWLTYVLRRQIDLESPLAPHPQVVSGRLHFAFKKEADDETGLGLFFYDLAMLAGEYVDAPFVIKRRGSRVDPVCRRWPPAHPCAEL